ncbi:MAG: 4Fe-4S dicluster domain-containing protein [Hyphomicrobiales bacterium]|nr:4Fe-4S dicluster domain-containing protein [Hyphomicrobiales bacterium]
MIASLGSHALQALAPEAAVTVDPARCVRHRSNRNDCRKCLDACAAGAIRWAESGLDVDASACTDCLACLAVCPTAALHSPAFALARTLNGLTGHPRPVLGCDRTPSADAHARVPCLGCLGSDEVMALLALTLKNGVQIDLTGCADCHNGHVVATLRAAHARLSDLHPAHGVRLVFDGQSLEFDPPELSRRGLFSLFRRRSADVAARAVLACAADAPASTFAEKRVPVRRRLLHAAMARLPEENRTAMGAALFGHVAFTPSCTACGACIGVCPTGAIRPSGKDGRPPRFLADNCVQCHSCQTFCRDQGVLADAGRTVTSSASLRPGPTVASTPFGP